MRLLYLPSGYVKIYKFLDECVLKELHSIDYMETRSFDFKKGMAGLKALCRSFKPDVFFMLVGDKIPTEMFQWLKKNGVKPILWATEDPYFIDRTMDLLPHCEQVFTIDKGAQNYYQKQGYQVELLPLGTDCNTFSQKPMKKKYSSDLCLIGFPYPSRVELVKKIIDNTNYRILVGGSGWQKHLRETRQVKIINGYTHPKKVAYYYSNAKIVLNHHREFQENSNSNSSGVINESVNNRTFDIAACGAFQLIEQKEDLQNYFVEGEEIITFTNENDLIDKIHFYIEENEQRKEIGEKGRRRVWEEHTMYHRVRTIMDKVLNN